jgi:hypothetical protein
LPPPQALPHAAVSTRANSLRRMGRSMPISYPRVSYYRKKEEHSIDS